MQLITENSIHHLSRTSISKPGCTKSTLKWLLKLTNYTDLGGGGGSVQDRLTDRPRTMHDNHTNRFINNKPIQYYKYYFIDRLFNNLHTLLYILCVHHHILSFALLALTSYHPDYLLGWFIDWLARER